MANNPTVVIGSLNDEELKKSIDKLVDHVDKQLNYMVSSTKVAVMSMQNSLKSLGDTKIDFGGAANGGATKRTKAQNEETAAIKESTQAYKDKKMALDQMASSQQVAIRSANPSGIRNADTLQTMNIQLDLLRERLREARQQFSSFVALAAHATTTGDKGLFQYATDGVHRYEQEVRSLIPQIRGLQDGIQQMGNVLAPQGHTIQNYVNSLQKANPELAQLNEQYKRGKSLLQEQTTSISSATDASSRYSEAIRRQAQAIRESQQWKEKGYVTINGVDIYNLENSTKSRISLEEQLVKLLNEEKTATSRVAQEQLKVAQNAAATNEQLEKARQLSNKGIGTTIGEKYGSVPTFTTQLESANALSKRLKELKEQYNSLSYGKRLSAEGQAIAQQIREITRQGQKLNNELNRPTKKEVFGLSEKTLDDIAYKMRQLSTYRGGLDASKQSREITQVNDEYNRLKNRMDEVMQKNQQMIASNTALGRSWNYMKNRLAFYFTVGASTSFIKNLIEVRSQYEMNERALGILVNSAERGTQIFNELSQMALVSPYTLIELSSAAKQLTAYDVAAKDVVDTTRRLADMAAAVGIPIERLTYALGQIKAYGYLNARDARMFANAGIPLVKQLSEYYTELEGRLVSTADVYDRIKKKQIGYEEVTSVIAKMTDEGGKFYDFQAKMAGTLKVQLANLTLAWNNMLNAMGEESQGVLVGGINALKQMFLHWKDIEHVLYELVIALGAYKAYQIITTRLMGATAASLDAQVLAMKRNKAAMLEKQALTRKLTIDELRQVAAQNQVTAADYRNALSGKQLTKQKALLLVALNKNNAQLKAAIVNMGLLTTQEVANITVGKAFAIVFKSIGISIKNAALAVKAFMASMWPLLVVGALYELYHAWDSYGEHIKEVNKQAAEHAKEAFDNIKQYLESESTINTQQRVVYKEGNPLTDAESQKAWDEMREKIELSSSASNTFIAKLMRINDINNRLAAGFDYLKDVQRVAGVMQTLEENAVDVSSTTLGGLFGEGLKDDLADFINAYQKYVSLNENLRQSGVGEKYFNDQKEALEEFRSEIEKTTTSLYNIASKEGFNTNEQREFFEREISEIAQAEQMGAKETRIFRMQAEKEYYAYARAQLVEQLEYQQGAQKAATENRIKDLDNEFGTNKALQESFFTWLAEKQDHAVKNMLRGKTQEEIKQGEWLKGANAKWVEEMAQKFSKEYGVSFDDLHRLVLNANTWSINIPVFFQTIGQPLSNIQRDYEARTGKKFSSNPLIKDAKTQVEILDILKKRQKEVVNEMETARKAGGKYWEDNKQRYKEENDALVADIHAYNALTDAEEKANKKGSKGSKKDPLLDTLKQEISLVEKLQSDYDKLSKSGASQTDALDTIRGAYGKTIRLLNTQLQSYGLPQIDISKLITGKDPHKSLEHFKQTLDTLVSKGLLTLERSKEIEAVIEKFTLSAKTYDLDKITKGLNSELDRLKDEYELAVALDADPELGSIFADWMGFDMDDLPRTAQEYANRATNALNKALKDRDADLELPNLLNITDDYLRELQNRVGTGGITQTYVDEITKAVKDVRGVFKKEKEDTSKEWNALIEKYGGLQAKLLKIYKDTVQQQSSIVKQFGNDEQISQALDLVRKIQISQDPADIARLQEQLAKIINDITSNNPIALKTYQATQNEQKREESKAYWENFKDSDLYAMTFEDVANLSNRAIDMMIEKLDELKDKVKESPESMKALIKAKNDLEEAKNIRDPFGGMIRGLKMSAEASKEAKTYRDQLTQADIRLENAEKNLEDAKASKDITAIAKAEQEVAKAKEKRETAQKNLTKAEDKGKKGQNTFIQSAQSLSQNMQTMGEIANQTAEIFRMFGENDTADAIAEIGSAFMSLIPTIVAVAVAIKTLEATSVILLAISAAISAVIGLVSFFSGNANKKITEQVEASERAVKRLENSYKKLEYAAEQAFGAATSGAQQALKANKELQLFELRRQLALEQSRTGKHYDEDKVLDLKGQIIDLENEIKDFTKGAVNDLLGISSHGDFFEDMISEMIDAFKSGEDAMKVFEEKWSKMIDNMIMKTIVSQVLQNWVNTLEDGADEILNKYTKSKSDKIAKINDMMTDVSLVDNYWDALMMIGNADKEGIDMILKKLGEKEFDSIGMMFSRAFGGGYSEDTIKQVVDIYKANMNNRLNALNQELDKASLDATGELIDYYGQAGEDFKANYLDVILGKIKENWNFGQDSENKLSQLQQGIQGITEDQAGALEAYWNANTQQQYVQSDLLREIRDILAGGDADIQTGVQAQMLLQLQQSYAVQMAIQGILEGWATPSGQAVRVELVS